MSSSSSLEIASRIAQSMVAYYRNKGYDEDIMAMSYDGIEIPAEVFVSKDIEYFREMNQEALTYTSVDHDIIFTFQALNLEPRSFFNPKDNEEELASIAFQALTDVTMSLGLPNNIYSLEDVCNWRYKGTSPIDAPEIFMKLAPYINNVQNKKKRHQ